MQGIKIHRLQIRINVKMVVPFLSLFLFTSPFLDVLLGWEHLSQVESVLVILLDIYIGMKFIRRPLKRNVVIMVFLAAAFYSWFVLPTLLYNIGELWSVLRRLIFSVSFILLLEYMFQAFGAKRTISALMLYMEVLLYVNLIAMLWYPNGLYHAFYDGVHVFAVRSTADYVRTVNDRVQWLLGHQTTMIRFFLPAIVIGILYSYMNSNKKRLTNRTIVLLLVCLIEMIIAHSATNYMVVAIMCFVMLMKQVKFKLRPWYFIPIIILVYLVLLQEKELKILSTFLTNFLGREAGFAVRIGIWVQAIAAWLEHPIIGWGYLADGSSEMVRIFGIFGNPHSTYLWTLYEGGIIGIILFILIYVYSCRNIKRCWNEKVTSVVFAAIIAMLAAMIVDDYVFRSQSMWILIIISSHIPDLVDAQIGKSSMMRT